MVDDNRWAWAIKAQGGGRVSDEGRIACGDRRRRIPHGGLTAFPAHPPDLQPEPSVDGGLRCLMPTRLTQAAYYSIPVGRVAVLPHGSFKRPLTRTPLRFANPSPPSGWIRDLRPKWPCRTIHAFSAQKGAETGFSYVLKEARHGRNTERHIQNHKLEKL